MQKGEKMKWKRKTFVAIKDGQQEIPAHKKQIQPITGLEAIILYLKLYGKATKEELVNYFDITRREIDRIFADLVKRQKIYCDLRKPTTYALQPELLPR